MGVMRGNRIWLHPKWVDNVYTVAFCGGLLCVAENVFYLLGVAVLLVTGQRELVDYPTVNLL